MLRRMEISLKGNTPGVIDYALRKGGMNMTNEKRKAASNQMS